MATTKLMMPQEIEVFYILPAIRRQFSISLKELGVPQKDIAKLLHVRESSISQYIHDKRANEVPFNDKIKAKIKKAAQEVKDGENLVMHTQEILKLIRSQGVLCDIHRKFAVLPSNCSLDKMGCC